MMERRNAAPTTTLVDILDRVLDKGLVVVGDIRVSLANVELLTIQVRLLVCSIDKAQEIGLDWWRRDSFLSSQAREDGAARAALQARVEALERQLGEASARNGAARRRSGRRSRRAEASIPETESRPDRQEHPETGGNHGG